jgi:integrase/recombinase XerD
MAITLLQQKKERRGVGRPKGSTRARKPIGEDEFNAFVEYINNKPGMREKTKKRHIQAAALLYFLGFRISELTKLRYRDIKEAVERGEGSLNNDTKTGKTRLLIYSETAVKVLEKVFEDELDEEVAKYEGIHDDDLIFHAPRKPRKPLNVAMMTERFNELLREACGPSFSSHSFRQSVITDICRAGNPKIAQAFIGHSNVSTTLRYVTPTETDVRSALSSVR